MKNPKSACLLCRHIVAAKGGARTPQWQPQISQFSTTLPPRDRDLASLALDFNPVKTTFEEGDSTEKKDPFRKVSMRDQSDVKKLRWLRNQHLTKKAKTMKGSAQLDALFQQIVRQQTLGEEMPKVADPGKAAERQALYKIIKELGEIQHRLDRGEPVAKVYNHFKTEIVPILRRQDMALPQACHRQIDLLIDMVNKAKIEAIRSPELPLVSELLLGDVRVGTVRPRTFHKLVSALIQEIVKMDTSAERPGSSVADDGLITQDAMLVDLIDCWKILSLPNTVHINPGDEVLEGFWFPRIDKYSITRSSKMASFPEAFSRAFPHYPPRQLGPSTAILGIVTYALLLDPRRSNLLRQRASRLVSRIAYLIMYVDYKNIRRDVKEFFPELEIYVMTWWRDIKKRLKKGADNSDPSAAKTEPEEGAESSDPLAAKTELEEALPSNDQEDINERSLMHSLYRAISARNTKEVDRRWTKFIMAGPDEKISPARIEELKKHPDVFDLFIYTWMALNQPDKAIAVLRTLRSVGIKTTLKTWNVMLDGCKKAHNLNGIKNVWAKLVKSGIKLDMKLWTTRVSGLMECGDFQGALDALREMTWLWNQSSKDENAKFVKPTIEPINAVSAGFLSQNQVTEAELLLEWAEKQGIQPDIFTYNPLLRRYIQDGRATDVRELLATMQERGVSADPATFTILIDAAFRQIPPGDFEAEARTVVNILEGMEKAGLEPNTQNYGKIIYNLLQGEKTATNAVRHVLSHLWDRGYELSPHIYTMLVDFFFSQQPPDIKSVESLLQRRRHFDYDHNDAILYDRIIHGYSKAGLPEQALRYYYRLSRANDEVQLKTQMEVVNALLQQGKDTLAREMVENTRKFYVRRHKNGEVEKAEFWDHLFWRMAAAHGFLELDQLPGRQTLS